MQKTHCAEVRSVTTAPPQLLGPAFLPLVFPANAGTQEPPSSGRQPKGHRATMTSAAQRGLFFKRAQAPCQQKTYCTEVRSVATAPPRLLGLSLSCPSFSRRTPGPRDHRALDGDQKDIGPPRAPRYGARGGGNEEAARGKA